MRADTSERDGQSVRGRLSHCYIIRLVPCRRVRIVVELLSQMLLLLLLLFFFFPRFSPFNFPRRCSVIFTHFYFHSSTHPLTDASRDLSLLKAIDLTSLHSTSLRFSSCSFTSQFIVRTISYHLIISLNGYTVTSILRWPEIRKQRNICLKFKIHFVCLSQNLPSKFNRGTTHTPRDVEFNPSQGISNSVSTTNRMIHVQSTYTHSASTTD